MKTTINPKLTIGKKVIVYDKTSNLYGKICTIKDCGRISCLVTDETNLLDDNHSDFIHINELEIIKE